MAEQQRPASSGPKPPASKLTAWREIHRRKNKDFLFSEDLGDVGTKIDVEIVDSGTGDIIGSEGKTRLPWLSFRGARKKLGLNPGNCKAMETLAGTIYIERWRGWITLVVIRTKYTDMKTKQRLETNAIRIAPERPRNPRKGLYIQELPPEPEPEAASIADEPEFAFDPEVLGASDGAPDAEEQAEIRRREAQEAR